MRIALSVGWIVILAGGYVAVSRHVSTSEARIEEERAVEAASAVAASASLGFFSSVAELRGWSANAALDLERGWPARGDDELAELAARIKALADQAGGAAAALDGDGRTVVASGPDFAVGPAVADVLAGAQVVIRLDPATKSLSAAAVVGRPRPKPAGVVAVTVPLADPVLRRWLGARDAAHIVLEGIDKPIVSTLPKDPETLVGPSYETGDSSYRTVSLELNDDAGPVGKAVGMSAINPCRTMGPKAVERCGARQGQNTTDFIKAAFAGIGLFATVLVWIVGGLIGGRSRSSETESRGPPRSETSRPEHREGAPSRSAEHAVVATPPPAPTPTVPRRFDPPLPKPEPKAPEVIARPITAPIVEPRPEPKPEPPPEPKVEPKPEPKVEPKPERPALPSAEEPIDLGRPRAEEPEKKPERPALPPADEPIPIAKRPEPERPSLFSVQARGPLIPVPTQQPTAAEITVTRGRGASPRPNEHPEAAPARAPAPKPDYRPPEHRPAPVLDHRPAAVGPAGPQSEKPMDFSQLPIPPLADMPSLGGLGDLPSLSSMGLADLPPLGSNPSTVPMSPLGMSPLGTPVGFDPPPMSLEAFASNISTGSFPVMQPRDSILPMASSPSSWAPPAMDIVSLGSTDAPRAFDEAHYRSVYMDFVGNKRQLGENVDNITYEGFSAKLRNSEQKLIDKHGCRAVRFQVMVKDRQVSLRPQLVR